MATRRKSVKTSRRARPAVPVALKQALQERDEALRFQAAIADILAALARSRESPQPVFDAIVRNVRRLFDTRYAVVFLIKGDQLHLAALHGDERFSAPGSEAAQRFVKSFPQPVDWTTFTGRAMKAGEVRQLVPIVGNPQASPRAVQLARTFGYNSMVTAPLVLDGRVVGTIGTNHAEARRYGERELAALKAFADQAVVAIENARLFNETKEALERQTAISEILEKISASPSDVTPVLETVAARAAHLCEAEQATVLMVEGGMLNPSVTYSSDRGPLPNPATVVQLKPTYFTGRAALEGRVINVEDAQALNESEYPEGAANQRKLGYRSFLAVPMLRKGRAIGVIAVWRRFVRPFSEKHVDLVKTFADQAAIAIENARLFNETKEALDQQTASADILRVISRSPTDVQPVFQAIVENSVRLCNGEWGALFTYDGKMIGLGAQVQPNAEVRKLFATAFPQAIRPDTPSAQSILERRVVNVADMQAREDYAEDVRQRARLGGYHAVLTVPMMRGDTPIGAIAVTRREATAFDEVYVSLLRTFADQAVIAIENVRLFNETKEALERQTATSEILKVISSSTTDTQPVFEAIVRSAAQLFPMSNATIFMRDGDLMRMHAVAGATVDDAVRRELASIYPIPFNPEVSTSARAMVERRINICVDTEAPDVPEHIRRAGRAGRFRSNAVVPLVRDDEGIGTIVIAHPQAGHRLNEKQLALLRTFADQAVIAIENTRLFNETNEALERQTATAEILKVISGSLTQTAPVFQAIVETASRLCDGRNVVIVMREEGGLQLRAWAGRNFSQLSDDQLRKILAQYPLPFDPATSASARAIAERRLIEVRDAEAADAPEATTRIARLSGGWRSATWVPLLRDGEGIGTIVLTDPRPGASLSDKQLTLLRTFASQAVIAIQNVRLFQEIQEKSALLEVANRHKSEFLANMSHELRTPLNAIIGFSEVLMERMFGEVNEKQADYLKDIHESGRHLLSLINDILDLSKIEAGRMELELATFDLPSAISNAMTLVRERAQRHGVQLGAQLDPRLGEWRADERKVKQILLNLLSNAVKFTLDGGRVDVIAKLDTDQVEIAVRDTGVGIAPEDQAKLFEEFSQVGRDGARKAEGTGLGLALARKFVELHGGAIGVESAPGKGATFFFSLPLVPAGRPGSSA